LNLEAFGWKGQTQTAKWLERFSAASYAQACQTEHWESDDNDYGDNDTHIT
jgi:hypothetical protein